MDQSVFIDNLKKQYLDLEGIEINLETEFRKVGSYDSLTGMTILVMIKDEYNVNISDTEYKALKTVKDLYNIVKSKL